MSTPPSVGNLSDSGAEADESSGEGDDSNGDFDDEDTGSDSDDKDEAADDMLNPSQYSNNCLEIRFEVCPFTGEFTFSHKKNSFSYKCSLFLRSANQKHVLS